MYGKKISTKKSNERTQPLLVITIGQGLQPDKAGYVEQLIRRKLPVILKLF